MDVCASIAFSLPLDVFVNLLFVESDRRDEVPDAPDAAVEVHLTDEFESLFELGTGFAFQALDDGSNRQIWWYFNLEVDMVFVRVDSFEVERRVLLDG